MFVITNLEDFIVKNAEIQEQNNKIKFRIGEEAIIDPLKLQDASLDFTKVVYTLRGEVEKVRELDYHASQIIAHKLCHTIYLNLIFKAQEKIVKSLPDSFSSNFRMSQISEYDYEDDKDFIAPEEWRGSIYGWDESAKYPEALEIEYIFFDYGGTIYITYSISN